jgi:hypothetical protein
MRRWAIVPSVLAMTAAGFAAGLLVASKMQSVQARSKSEVSFAAVPGEKGGEDIAGPYDPVPDWPKPLTSLPGHENWTWGAVEGKCSVAIDQLYAIEGTQSSSATNWVCAVTMPSPSSSLPV